MTAKKKAKKKAKKGGQNLPAITKGNKMQKPISKSEAAMKESVKGWIGKSVLQKGSGNLKRVKGEPVTANVIDALLGSAIEIAIVEKKLSRNGKRERISKQKKAFNKWVADSKIDLNKYSVNQLEIQVEAAFIKKEIPYKLSHSTLAVYLKDRN
ncbi:MAG: hypothetical protein IT234_04610 [Bacteroidia bacterium]|nr:hypothetical protein [Bacteroidia bacterium]